MRCLASPFCCEMINHRRFVGYAGSSACHHVWKVIVLLEAPARLGENGMELSPERTILDILDLTRQIDPAMPNFHRRQFRQGAHASPISFNRFCCSCTRALLGKSLRECRYRNARSQPLEVNRKSTPGKVSSKSWTSNRMFSSGVAKAPKFIRWQSPHAWTAIPTLG
jgi:hypothetical protein